MNIKEKVIVSWSGGKDSAFAFYEAKMCGKYELLSLLTTTTEDYDRISMHGVRRVLLESQARSLGVSLDKVLISKNSSNEEYESRMRQTLEKHLSRDIFTVVFGDIFLEDLKKYREDKLKQIGMKAVFPIWKRDTVKLANAFIESGFRAIITCVDSDFLESSFVGREFDKDFLSQLPSGVDPCGENGEFHSFVYDGPIFKNRILFNKGEIVLRDNRFFYCDLIPV